MSVITNSRVTVRKVSYSPEAIAKIEKIATSQLGTGAKKEIFRRITGTSGCCVCSAVPYYEIIYQLEGATQIQRYCEKCFSKRDECERVFGNPKEHLDIIESVRDYMRKKEIEQNPQFRPLTDIHRVGRPRR